MKTLYGDPRHGVIYFIGLLVLTLFAGAPFWAEAAPLGFASLLWTTFLAYRLRILSHTFRRIEHVTQTKTGLLPGVLVQNLHQNDRLNRSQRALIFLDRDFIILSVIILLGFTWLGYIAFYPAIFAPVAALTNDIAAFGLSFPVTQSIFAMLGMLLIVSIAFIAQSYAYDAVIGRVILSVSAGFSVIFVLLLFMDGALNFVRITPFPDDIFQFWHGIGPGNIELYRSMGLLADESISVFTQRIYVMGVVGTGFIYAIGGFVFMILLRGLFQKNKERFYALTGLGLLLILFLTDLLMAADRMDYATEIALWISGWTGIAVCLVRCKRQIRRSYRLYST